MSKREVRTTKTVDVQYWVKDEKTGRRRYQTKQVSKACVPTRCCTKCSRSDLYCVC